MKGLASVYVSDIVLVAKELMIAAAKAMAGTATDRVSDLAA